MKILTTYKNGNSNVEIYEDGTRIITSESSSFNFDYPSNIDIRVSNRCLFGLNPKTNKSFCGFCHEDARTDGVECDYKELKEKLTGLPKGVELAIGCNEFTFELHEFIVWSKLYGFIVNLTVNQGHINLELDKGIKLCMNDNMIYGLGISYRSNIKWNVPKEILEYPHTLFNVIVGIDDINDILLLKEKGVKKIVVLGEKDFGRNKGNVNLNSKKHKEWYWWVGKLFDNFEIVSFDNLALEQLNMRRFFNDDKWNEFYQFENSFYINAVNEYFAPSSRSNKKTNWENLNCVDYYKQYIKYEKEHINCY